MFFTAAFQKSKDIAQFRILDTGCSKMYTNFIFLIIGEENGREQVRLFFLTFSIKNKGYC
jgi:hypothetical protein